VHKERGWESCVWLLKRSPSNWKIKQLQVYNANLNKSKTQLVSKESELHCIEKSKTES
jgi:hypothetical protein